MPDPHDAGLAEIADALADQDSYEHLRLPDPRDGHIAFWSADTGIDGFADELPDGQASDRLTRAIQGKGAFRRFKRRTPPPLHATGPPSRPRASGIVVMIFMLLTS